MCLNFKCQRDRHQEDIKKKVLISNDNVDDLLHALFSLYNPYATGQKYIGIDRGLFGIDCRIIL